jgi:acetyltransferase-like isoleucine patch superfamily enzyme
MLGRLFQVLRDDPGRIPERIWGELLGLRLAMRRNVIREGRVVLIGNPLIDIRRGCKLVLGNGVMLTSKNRGYHLNMPSPVKLFAYLPGAEIRIGDETRIAGACINAHKSVVIGKRCLIAANCQIMDSNGHDLSFHNLPNRFESIGPSVPVVIEDDVWIGINCIVLPGVRIGRGAVISANSVVCSNIPPMAIARGNPAQVIFDYSADGDDADEPEDTGQRTDGNHRSVPR